MTEVRLTKNCNRCKQVKLLSEFHKRKSRPIGVSPWCKKCNCEYAKELINKDRKKASESWKKTREKRIDKINAYMKEYREKNKEEIRKQRVEYNLKHSKRLTRVSAEYQKENPLKVKASRARRRFRLKNSPSHFKDSDVKRLMKLQKKKCVACRTDISGNFHVDHILPLAKGGTNEAKNIQLLCPSCNHTKQARDPIDFMQSKGFLI